MTGLTSIYWKTPVSKIFRNNGHNTFTQQTSILLTGVSESSVSWGDYDNDGYFDILLSGRTENSDIISKIYHNDGANNFTEETSIVLPGISRGSARWGDYDNDDYLDILLTGMGVSKIYHNNENNTFKKLTSFSINGISISSSAWGDYDNDGYLDILLTGTNSNPLHSITKIYRNSGNGTFTEQTWISFTGVNGGSAAWGDYIMMVTWIYF